MNPAPMERKPRPARPPRGGPVGWLDRLAKGLLAAVVVSRLLTPTDAAAVGETLWVAQFTLLALVVWAVTVYRAGILRLQFDWVDVAVLLLCLGHMAGALVVICTSGDKRAALNMLWEWCGVAATFFLMQRLLDTPAARRSMLLVVAAVAVSLSGLGLWQHYGGYAEMRRDYDKKKSEMESLAASGRPADPAMAVEWERAMQAVQTDLVRMRVPGDESARMLWEQRLNSSEPIGMFALANTLAGILASMSIVWIGIVARADRRVPRWQVAAAGILSLMVLYCLLLTKSRTAFVGLLSGLAVWVVASGLWRSAARRPLKNGDWLRADAGKPEKTSSREAPVPLFQHVGWRLVAGLTGAIGLVVVAALSGGLDRLVVSESAKSLRYRFEYWTGTRRMLADSPRNWLIGVGPGNFRQNYLPFKLPQSSEEIADPHNLVLDVWSNGGVVALAGLVGVCAAGLRPVLRPSQTPPADDGGEPSWGDGFLAGGVLGHLAVLVPGGGSDETVVLLLLGWMSVVSACRALYRRDLPPVVYAAAFAALTVHLAAAGGIGMPGIVQTLLLLIVLGRPMDGTTAWAFSATSGWARAAAGLAALALYFGCWFTGLTPVIGAREKLAAGQYELVENGRPSKAEREYRLAAEADPWSAEAYEKLSELAFQSWLSSDAANAEAFARAVALQQKAIDRNPRHAGGYQVLGRMYLSKFGRTRETADASAAAEAFGHAVALYPNYAESQSELALALWKEGAVEPAMVAARRALELDAINEQAGHTDKRLPAARRELMEQVLRGFRQKAN